MHITESLHFVVKNDCLREASELINQGAEVNAPDYNGWSALHYVKSKQMSSLLLNNGAYLDTKKYYRDFKTLVKAVEDGYEDKILALIDQGANLNAQDWYGQSVLLYARSRSIIKLLLSKGAKVNIRDKHKRTPLHEAAIHGREAAMSALLEHKADVKLRDEYDRMPLHHAAGASCDKSGGCAKTVRIVRLLLEYGANVDAQDIWGHTALHNAVDQGCESRVRILLDHKADVNACDCDGKSALFRARSESITRLLLDQGADISIKDKHKNTAVHEAAKCGLEEVLLVLVEYGAEMNLQDENGQTELHHAFIGRRITGKKDAGRVIELLLQHQADIAIKDKKGNTPLDYAGSSYNSEDFLPAFTKLRVVPEAPAGVFGRKP